MKSDQHEHRWQRHQYTGFKQNKGDSGGKPRRMFTCRRRDLQHDQRPAERKEHMQLAIGGTGFRQPRRDIKSQGPNQFRPSPVFTRRQGFTSRNYGNANSNIGMLISRVLAWTDTAATMFNNLTPISNNTGTPQPMKTPTDFGFWCPC